MLLRKITWHVESGISAVLVEEVLSADAEVVVVCPAVDTDEEGPGTGEVSLALAGSSVKIRLFINTLCQRSLDHFI